MYVSELSVVNFRNYKRQTVCLGEGLNFVVGNNAQGKTNLLEAVYLCSVGKSARTPRDKELINFGADRALIKLTVVKSCETDKVEIALNCDSPKKITVNGMPISRMGELMGVVGTVFFSPDEMRIVKESPFDRRRFMDIALCQMSRTYFYLLTRYNKTLMQRNKLLKSGESDDALDVWDMQLVECGARIIKTRRGFIDSLNGVIGDCHNYLTDGKERLVLGYESIEGSSVEEIKEAFSKRLQNERSKDKLRGYTHSGAHKDDISFMIGDMDIRAFGSQGQQRTASLSLKLAEAELVAQKGETPVLLLDDVLNELDICRRQRLIDKLSGFQTIITCTHIDSELKLGDYSEIKIEGGVAEKIR